MYSIDAFDELRSAGESDSPQDWEEAVCLEESLECAKGVLSDGSVLCVQCDADEEDRAAFDKLDAVEIRGFS